MNESTVLILQYVSLAGAIFIQQSKNSGAPYLHICLFFNHPSPPKKVDEKKRKEGVKEYKERKRRKMRQKTENKKERERRL